MFFNIFKNEISYWLDRPAFYVYSLIFLFIVKGNKCLYFVEEYYSNSPKEKIINVKFQKDLKIQRIH